MKNKNLLFVVLLAFILFSCSNNDRKGIASQKIVEESAAQTEFLLKKALEEDRIPRTENEDGSIQWTRQGFDWTEGFFPGTCWYFYENTKDERWRNAAEKFQKRFEEHKFLTSNHDLGFVFNCSYGNGYRITNSESFKKVMITAGNSLITRFNPTIGAIKSWDVKHGWQSKRNWTFPVIIDNMMNLELLFEVSEFTNKDTYRQIAITHANTTLKNHFRDDFSSYHVVDYDPETGAVRTKETAQGFANESAWARGQAWGLYGFTVCYRYTKDQKYLKQANRIAKFILENGNMPEDGIPYWDFNAGKIPDEPRDVSAAAITASALIELDKYSDVDYKKEYTKILKSLASDKYTAKIGANHGFILKHSVGSIPHGNEIDVPLNYADYYYVEALMRYNEEYSSKSQLVNVLNPSGSPTEIIDAESKARHK